MQHQQHHAHIDPRPRLPETPQALTRDLVARFSQPGGTGWLVLFGLLLLAGVVGFVLRLSGGFDNRAAWGYYAAIFAFLMSTALAAPILGAATRFTKGFWRKPLVRVTEMYTVVGILSLLMLLPILPLLPPLDVRSTFWVCEQGCWPGAPQSFLFLSVLGLVACGLGLLYTSARPDIAAVNILKGRGPSGGWRGTPYQWKVQRTAITYFSALYFMMLVFVHFMISTEMAITLVPGWRDPIFPAFHGISSIQAGLATVILTLGILRATGYKDYLALDQFWNPAKILLAFSLLWFYFWWSGFIVMWYGRTPPEQGVLYSVMFGPTFVPFVIGFICSFVAPVLLLIWNPIRVSIKGPIIVSSIILVGNFFDRVRIYTGSFGSEPGFHVVHTLPVAHFPDLADALLVLGAIGGVGFSMMVAMRFIPVLALWEMTEMQLLTRVGRLMHSDVVVVGKPE